MGKNYTYPDVVGEFGDRWNLASHYPVCVTGNQNSTAVEALARDIENGSVPIRQQHLPRPYPIRTAPELLPRGRAAGGQRRRGRWKRPFEFPILRRKAFGRALAREQVCSPQPI